MKEFAPGVPRIDHKDFKGLVDFPTNDVAWRKSLFIDKVMNHRAKANLYMLKAIIEYVSEPGDRIMDIMSGTGSILIAAVMGRGVTCIEISPKYFGWIEKSLAKIAEYYPGVSNQVSLINASCQQVLPIPTNHIIFSPPYADIMRKQKITEGDITADIYGLTKEEEADFMEYDKHPDNVGNRNRFFYNMEMEKIYKLAYESVKPGGTMTIILKDYIEKGKRVFLSDWALRACIRIGFEQYGWFKWPALGSPYTRIHRAQGKNTVDQEDIMIFQKPLPKTVQPVYLQQSLSQLAGVAV